MLDLLIILVLGHLVTDFVLQSDETCQSKYDPDIRSRLIAHFKHMAMYLIVNMALVLATGSLSLSVVVALGILALTHGVLDLGKSFLTSKEPNLSLLLIDQALHLISIVMAVGLLFPGAIMEITITLVTELGDNQSIAHVLSGIQKAGLLLSMLIFVTAGANVMIRAILTSLNIKMTFNKDLALKTQENAIKTGRYIGGVERILTVMAMLAGSYEAIIALYASKTAIRFKHASGNPEFEEYYILGTLISVLIGISSGILLKIIL